MAMPRGKRDGALHEKLVADLVAHGAQVRNFMAALRKIVHPACWPDLRQSLVIPDAFVVDEKMMHVTAYEVEISYPVSAEKLERYHDLFWTIDQEEWILHLVLVDRIGRHRSIDLFRSCTEHDAGKSVDDETIARLRAHLGIRRVGQAPWSL